MNILRCQTCLNLSWIKSYNVKQIFLLFPFFSILEENLFLINGHIETIFDHFSDNYIKIFHKTEIQTVIFRCLVFLYLNWIKSYDIILVKNIFFHAWKCIISGLFCRSEFWHLLRKPALMFSKWLFFQNSLELSWDK